MNGGEYCFEPQRDITTYELAYIIAHLSMNKAPRHGVFFAHDKWEALPPEIKRHWKEKASE